MRNGLLSLLLFSLALIFSGCSEDKKTINLAVQKEGKTYMYCALGESIVTHSLSKGDYPVIMAASQIVYDKGEVFIEVNQISTIVDLLAKHTKFHETSGGPFEGYITTNLPTSCLPKTESKQGKELGDVITTMTYHLGNGFSEETYPISYQLVPEQKPLENCEMKSLWVAIHGNQGGEGYTKKDHVVVRLSDLMSFYGNPYQFEYLSEKGLLLFK